MYHTHFSLSLGRYDRCVAIRFFCKRPLKVFEVIDRLLIIGFIFMQQPVRKS